MCGRFSFAVPKEKSGELFPGMERIEPLEAHFNIAPTQFSSVITNDRPETIQQFQWGLIPFWSKTGKPEALMINARAESIFEKAGKINSLGEVVAENQLRGYFIMNGEQANIKISFTLTPENPALIQEYHISLVTK